jgi:hypothetical protein
MKGMTRAEIDALQRLIRQREKVLKSAAAQRSAELVADFENQMGSQYSFDQDEVWAKAAEAADREVKKAQAQVAARCRELCIPNRFAPNGELILRYAGKLGFEGVVSKTINAPYAPGNRGLWRKAKWLNRQEFVVVGWSDPEGTRPHLGALLLAYYTDDGKLIYAGRVGTGMPVEVLADLRRRLDHVRSGSLHRSSSQNERKITENRS